MKHKHNKKSKNIKQNLPSDKMDFSDKFDLFFEKHSKLFLILSLGFTLIFSFLLFDLRVSDGGDDSAYIVRAYNFIKQGEFPSFQGPLYPIVLSLFVAVFGVKLGVLKVVSLLAMVGQAYFLYKAFYKRIPASILFPSLLAISLSTSMLYFSSQTYSEAFFMLLQSIFFFLFFKYFIDFSEKYEMKKDYKKLVLFGLSAFALIWTRNVAYGLIVVLIAYFILSGEWKKILYSLASIFAMAIPFELIKKIFFSADTLQIKEQSSGFMLKHYYNPALGNEDFMGFVERFFTNIKLYLSKHLFTFMGFKPVNSPQPTEILGFIVVALLVLAFIFVLKKNRYLLFTIIYLTIMYGLTFILVQTHWDQARLIAPFYFLTILMMSAAFYYLLKMKAFKKFQFLYLIPLVIVIYLSGSRAVETSKNHSKALKAHLAGNIFYEMTPDWANFIKMSQWVAKNIDKKEVVASRKPEIGFVYSGRSFHGIYNVTSLDPEDLVQGIEKEGFVPISIDIRGIDTDLNIQDFHLRNSKFLHYYLNAGLIDEYGRTNQSHVVSVYLFPDSLMAEIEAQLTDYEIETTDVIQVMKKVQDENWTFAIHSPDELLEEIKEFNVKYFILASLRKIESNPQEGIITTLHRYLYFIQLKYPNFYTPIHTIGTTEPTTLVRLNY